MKSTDEQQNNPRRNRPIPVGHADSGSRSRVQLTEQDRAFIQAMNEFVEKYGSITDDEFFRVL